MATPAEDEDEATLEAARWLLLIEEEPEDVELRARFHAWLAASPANADAWANTADVYALMAQTPPALAERWRPAAARRSGEATPVVRGAPSRDRARPAFQRRRSSMARRAAAAVIAAAMVACLAVFMVPRALLRIQADHLTGTAEQRTLTLADGTTVHLGPASAIEVDLAGRERRITLLAGEVFFEVARDPDRPFHVLADGVETTVLGTVFNVHRGERGAAISVRDGHVRVDYRAAVPPVSEDLVAGDWVRVAWSGQVSRGTLQRDAVAPWRHGQIVARDQAMASVIDDLRRYYRGVIVLSDAGFGHRRVSGVYNVADPVAALQALAGAHGGTVRQFSPWVVVVSGN